jgi:hypothetical protein
MAAWTIRAGGHAPFRTERTKSFRTAWLPRTGLDPIPIGFMARELSRSKYGSWRSGIIGAKQFRSILFGRETVS